MYKELEDCTTGDIVIIDGVMLLMRGIQIDGDGDLSLFNVGSTSVRCVDKDIAPMDWQYINVDYARSQTNNIHCIGNIDSFAKVIEEHFK
jgi:hypothetical protein